MTSAVEPATDSGGASRWPRRLVVLGAVIISLIGIWQGGKAYLKHRVFVEARRRGVELTARDISVGWTSVEVIGATARPIGVASAVVTLPRIVATRSGVSIDTIELHDPSVEVSGAPHQTLKEALSWYESYGKEIDPRVTLKVLAGQLRWRELRGPGTEFFLWGAIGTTDNLTAKLSLRAGKKEWGPFLAGLEHAAGKTELSLSPPSSGAAVPAAIRASLTGGTLDKLSIRVDGAKFQSLGVDPDDLGFHSSRQSLVHINTHATRTGDGYDVVVDGRLAAVVPDGFPSPVDVLIDVRATTKGAEAVPLKGTLSVGPLRGNVTGTLAARPHLAVSATWTANKVACAELLKRAAGEGGLLAELGGELLRFAHRTGLARVVGEMFATIEARFDASAPESAVFKIEKHGDCGVNSPITSGNNK